MRPGLDHIGIAVRSLAMMVPFYERGLGLEFGGIEEVPEQKVRVAIFHAGESRIELLEGTDETSPVSRFIEKRGEGIHHICYRVGDLAAELERLRVAGVRLVDELPRPGAGGGLVAFIHPSSAGGVLIELSQHQDRGHEQQLQRS